MPAHLLRLLGIQQSFHRYVPQYDYLAGPSNLIADTLYHNFDLEWAVLVGTRQPYLPPDSGHQVWHPSPKFVDTILAALL